MKKNKKLNVLKARLCLVIIILIIIFVIYFIKSKENQYKDLTILLNNNFINTENTVIIDDNKNIYFSKDDIQKIFDESIYYNQAEKELITTYNTHVALLKMDEEYASIDDENIKLNGYLQEINDKVYLPIKDLAKAYDIEVNYVEKSNRIIIDSTLEEKIEAKLIKKSKVTEKKGFFNGKTLEKLIIGDKVIILESDGKYKKIKTPLGNIGYIKANKLSDENLVREKQSEEKVNIEVYSDYSNISGVYNDFQVDSSKLNVVIPTFFHINKNSEILDKTTSTTATYAVYKNWAEKNSLQILPTLTDDENVSDTLLSYSQRTGVINALKSYVQKYNYAGVNIDFQSIDDVNSFYRFIIELYPRFKQSNLKVVITLKNNLDRNRLEKFADYIIE